MSALSPAVLAQLARDSLADARRLIGEAQSRAKDAADWAAHGCHDAAATFRGEASRRLAEARTIIASARKLYAQSMAQLAKRGQLTHHYAEWAHGRFRALVRVDGATAVWSSPRTYGKRQSAQRAAARHIEKLRLSAACAGVTA